MHRLFLYLIVAVIVSAPPSLTRKLLQGNWGFAEAASASPPPLTLHSPSKANKGQPALIP